MPLAAHADRRPLRARPPPARHAPPVAARGGAVSRRRPDPRRGVRVRIVPAEPHVPSRSNLLGLPRCAHTRAARTGQRSVHALPCGAELRRAGPPPPRAGLIGCAVRQLPHAGAELHGRRPAPGPQSARAAPGPFGRDRHAERLQRLPRGSVGAVGGGRGRRVVRTRARAPAALRTGSARRSHRGSRCCATAPHPRRRRGAAGDRARDRAVPAGGLSGPGQRGRRAEHRARSRRAVAAREPVGGGEPAAGADRGRRRTAPARSGARGAHRGGARPGTDRSRR